ncbi:MAG: MFS transporter [Leucobacter sp.]|nr:MFS transporter [Leucobacter sp.]
MSGVTRRQRILLPWAVWGVAATAYAIAIINRSSFASLGTVTQNHFGIDATTLATFAVIQLAIYAGMQIPVGTLLDRFGASALILSGGLLMMSGQLIMATVHDVGLAILARVFVGAGDACTFISVMRLLPDWFSVRQLPLLGQLTGFIGQAGQLVSVTPLALVVDAFGWARGFIGVAAVGLLVVLLGAATLRDRPGQGTIFERMTGRFGSISRNAKSLGTFDDTATLLAASPPSTSIISVDGKRTRKVPGAELVHKFRRALSIPGVRLAFWVHFTAPFGATSFVLLWGTPFLTGGVGLSQAVAGGLLSLVVITGMIAGVVLGPMSSRFMEKRVWMVITSISLSCLIWLIVLCWPGAPPVGLLVVLMIVIAVGGPVSMIAFEVMRSHAPASYAGFATGLVNTGGFIAALLVIFFIGLVLDLQGAGEPERYSLSAFKWAMSVQIPFWLFGLAMIFIELRRTGRWMRAHGRTLR